jgi:hypothetical protein
MLLTVADIQAALETDLPGPTLSLFLEAAESEIVGRFGASSPRTERLIGSTRHVFLSQAAAGVSSVKEYADNDTTGTTLAATDYALRFSGLGLERLGGAWWQNTVEVTYTPADDAARRKRVQLDLVRLFLTYRGAIKSEDAEGYSASSAVDAAAYDRERERILSALAPTLGVVV